MSKSVYTADFRLQSMQAIIPQAYVSLSTAPYSFIQVNLFIASQF